MSIDYPSPLYQRLRWHILGTLPPATRRILVQCSPWREGIVRFKETEIPQFQKHQSIFVHIPKTSGISVSKSLFNCTSPHVPMIDYEAIFSQPELDRMFKFAFVRNPWDRAVSTYSFLAGRTGIERDIAWADRVLVNYTGFDDFIQRWLNRRNIYSWGLFFPQFFFVCNSQQEIRVDFLGRFENLNADFEYIKHRLGISAELLHLNKSKSRTDYRDYYTEKTRQIVADVYREDVELFGYQF